MEKSQRQENLKEIAAVYCKYLQKLDFKDNLYMLGIREGKNKFLSNSYLCLVNKYDIKTCDYYTEKVKTLFDNGQTKGKLTFEHMVPKQKYIQDICEQKAKEGKINESFILSMLEKYWHIALITKDEAKGLKRNMPKDWDNKNIFARYEQIGLKLIKNDEYF